MNTHFPAGRSRSPRLEPSSATEVGRAPSPRGDRRSLLVTGFLLVASLLFPLLAFASSHDMRITEDAPLSRAPIASEEREEKVPPPFSPGEELQYKITALGMKAGQARVQVGSETSMEGVEAWPVVVQARTDSVFDSIYSVRDRFISWWDPVEGRVVGADFYANERGKKHRSRSRLDHERGKAEVFRHKEWNGEKSTRSYDIPSGSFDIAGAIFALRQRELVPGKVEEVDVFTGSKVFRLRCRVEKIEKIRVGAGTFDAIATKIELGFDGNFASKRDVRAWFSNDERKVPLRVEADLVLGSVVADLSSAKRGVAR